MSGNCGAGAAGQVAGEVAAGAYLKDRLATLENRDIALNIAEISGALGGLAAGGDAQDIGAAAGLGRTAAGDNVIPVAVAVGVEACVMNPACVTAAASLAAATGIALTNAYYQISEWAYVNRADPGTYQFNSGNGNNGSAKQNPVGGSVAAAGGESSKTVDDIIEDSEPRPENPGTKQYDTIAIPINIYPFVSAKTANHDVEAFAGRTTTCCTLRLVD